MAFLRPKSRDELLKAIHEHPDYIMVAGATDVMPKIRRGAIKTSDFIDLTSVPTANVTIDNGGNLHIPGATTAAVLANTNNSILARWPLLVDAARHLGSTLIRTRATLAGNLCTASPCGDMILALVAYEATIKLSSINDSRLVRISDFLTGPGRTCRAADEWVEEIILPAPLDGTFSRFCKTGRRNSMVIAVASMAANIHFNKGQIDRLVLAFGSVGPTTLRATAAENYLLGKKLTPEIISEAAQLVYSEVKPISDQRASAEYRRLVCRDFLAAVLEEAAK